VDYKNLSYTTTWFELQCVGDFTWTASDCEELVGLLTGDEGIGNAFPTVLPNADYSYYTLKTSGFKTF